MTELFLFNPLLLIRNLNIEHCFFICLTAIFFCNILCLILTLFKREYGTKKRLWAVFFGVGASFFMLSLELQNNVFPLGAFICLSVVIIFLFVQTLSSRNKKTEVGSKEFARYIDSCINSSSNPIQKSKTEFSSSLIKPTTIENFSHDEIDFSHAKTILSKLEYYPLKEQDKKTAKDLENAINLAEQNGLDSKLKQDINDGLGALLKIMAKYAI